MRLVSLPALRRAAQPAAFTRPQQQRQRAAAAPHAPRASGAPAAPARLASGDESAAPYRGAAGLAAHLHAHNVRAMVLPEAEAAAQEAAAPSDAVLKTLVFAAGEQLVAVVLPLAARVDTRKLARALGLRRSALRLAPPAAAEAATGYAVGDIPPMGHAQRLRVLLDAAALAGGPARALFAGGGGDGASLRIPAAELLRATAAEVADVAAGRTPDEVATLMAAVAAAFSGPPHEALLGAWSAGRDAASPRGGHVTANVADALLASPAPAVVDATVGRVRRMGRLLLFASLLQPAWHRGGDDVAEGDALQALAGRTFAAAFADEDAAADALRAVRPGTRLRVAGRLQPNPRPGCVDIVVAELRLIAADAALLQAGPPADEAGQPAADAAEPADPDAWFLEASDEEDDETEEGDDEEFDDEFLEDDAEDDAEDFDNGRFSRGGRYSAPLRPRRRSARRRSAHGAPELAPLRPFALPAGVSVSYVDCGATVASMAALLLDPASATHAPLDGTADDDVMPAAVGLDSEWRPYAKGEPSTPVALLQLCSRRHAFLVDVQALAAAADGGAAMAALGAFLRDLLASAEVLKLGLGLRYDLARLAESHAALALGGAPARGLLELRAAAACAAPQALPWLPRPARLLGAGLASLARLALRVELDKGAQVSDWAARPLTEAQRRYAAADALVLMALFDSLHRRSAALRKRLPALLDAPPAGLPRRGRSSGGGAGRNAPSGPPLAFKRGDKLAPSALRIEAEALLRAFLGAPLPAKGRDAALAAAAGAGGGRARGAGGCRGGVLECANATLLFMNAEPVAGKRYPNTFWRQKKSSADPGDPEDLMVSWFANPGQDRDAPQVQRLCAADAMVLLFARLPRGPYVLCGRLVCEGTSGDDDATDDNDLAAPPAPPGLLRLSMRLLDAEPLCGSAHFAALLQHAQGDAGLALLRR